MQDQAYLTIYRAESYASLYEQLALGQLAGLTARPGVGSPGSLTLDTFGIGSAFYAIAAGKQPASIPIPELGRCASGRSTRS